MLHFWRWSTSGRLFGCYRLFFGPNYASRAIDYLRAYQLHMQDIRVEYVCDTWQGLAARFAEGQELRP